MIPVDVAFPRVALVEQHIESPRLDDVPDAIRAEIARLGVARKVRPGMSVAVTAGSRGITGIDVILATVVAELKRMGAEPFVVPCMGSHGGANAAGQVEVLHSLGVTEETMGCPIRASMEAVQIGVTPEGIPVYQDKFAFSADGIVVVNRIKAHTDFTGPVESGLMKMLTIGLGKHTGALSAHRHAIRYSYAVVIASMAREVIRRAPLLFGLGIVENADDETALVSAIWPQDFETVERDLLQRAKTLMPRLPFHQLDVLLIDDDGQGNQRQRHGLERPRTAHRLRRRRAGQPAHHAHRRLRSDGKEPRERDRRRPRRLHNPPSGRQDRPVSDLCQWTDLRLAGARASADGRRA